MKMWSTIEELILLRSALNSGGGIEKTITGNPIHILDALAKPAQALSVKLEPMIIRGLRVGERISLILMPLKTIRLEAARLLFRTVMVL